MMGRKPVLRDRILTRAAEMKMQGDMVNKSRIARELHCSIRQVMRVLPSSVVASL